MSIVYDDSEDTTPAPISTDDIIARTRRGGAGSVERAGGLAESHMQQRAADRLPMRQEAVAVHAQTARKLLDTVLHELQSTGNVEKTLELVEKLLAACATLYTQSQRTSAPEARGGFHLV